MGCVDKEMEKGGEKGAISGGEGGRRFPLLWVLCEGGGGGGGGWGGLGGIWWKGGVGNGLSDGK